MIFVIPRFLASVMIIEHLLRRHVPGGQGEIVLLDQVQNFEHFGNQLAVARDDGLGPRRLLVVHLVLGIVGRHPDDAPVAAFHVSHVADGLRVDAADRRVERDAAEDLDALCAVLPNELRETRRLGPVVLQDDGAQPTLLRQLHDFERVPLAGVAVGTVVRVQVDGSREDGSVSFWSTDGLVGRVR